MPIKFRCRHCRQFLGISRAKAGELTDCPMCGKTIRVPNLDGSIGAIPNPELDLGDADLLEALDELAGIGGSPPSAAVTVPPRITETHDATVVRPEPVIQSRPAPVIPARVVRPEDQDTIVQVAVDAGTVVSADDPLRALSDSALRLSRRDQRRQRSRRTTLGMAGAIGALLLGLVSLVWFLRDPGPRPPGLQASAESSPAFPPAVANPAPPNDVVEPGGEERAAPAINGRVTFASESNALLPDAGARVLLLPASKPGTVKLDVAGFLAGAEPIDTAVARAAIRAMGGDVATADDDGRYELIPNGPGDYHLLVISRHCGRPSTQTVQTELQDVLSAFFFRPASLVGSLSFQFDRLR
ncbi:MAG: hypothetical protein KF861_18810, partial [Planctomycetaceae bacterium]|nr:hypothetical protein [Planctomycetaceae bacterium]